MRSLTVAAKGVQGTLSICPWHLRLGCTKCGVVGGTRTVTSASVLEAANFADLHQLG